jgi:hypothetical protein
MYVSLSVIVKPRKMRRPRPPRGCRAIEKQYYQYWSLSRIVFDAVSSDNMCLYNKRVTHVYVRNRANTAALRGPICAAVYTVIGENLVAYKSMLCYYVLIQLYLCIFTLEHSFNFATYFFSFCHFQA